MAAADHNVPTESGGARACARVDARARKYAAVVVCRRHRWQAIRSQDYVSRVRLQLLFMIPNAINFKPKQKSAARRLPPISVAPEISLAAARPAADAAAAAFAVAAAATIIANIAAAESADA